MPSEDRKIRTINTDDGWTHVVRGRHQLKSANWRGSKNARAHTPTLPDRLESLSLSDAKKSHLSEEQLTPAQRGLYFRLKSENHLSIDLIKKAIEEEERSPTSGTPAEPVVSIKTLHKVFDQISKEWKERSGPSVESYLRANDPDLENRLFSIDTAVCLGLGSPSSEHFFGRKDTLWQLAFFIELLRSSELIKRARNDQGQKVLQIEAYAQDPLFNDTDKTFFQSLGIVALESPAAFGKISATTFVFAPHLPVVYWNGAMRKNIPLLLIGNDVAEALPRIIDEATILRLFGRLLHVSVPQFSPIKEKKGGDEDVDEEKRLHVPDSNIRTELEKFVKGHNRESAFPFPKLNENRLDLTFANMLIYLGGSFSSASNGSAENLA